MSCNSHKIAIIILCLIFIIPNGISQQLSFKNYSIDEGLSSAIVYNTFQDSKGYIWFSTEMGIARFDGLNFRIFNTDDGLINNIVFQVYEDFNGRIWVRSMEKKLCYFENNKFFKYNKNNLIQLEKHELRTIDALHVTKDTLFIGFSSGVVLKISNNKVITLNNTFFYPNNNNSLYWFKNQNDSAFNYNSNKSILKLYLNRPRYDLHRPMCIELKNKKLLFGNNFHLVLFNQNKVLKEFLLKFRINSILEDDNGNIWIGTYGDGVYFYENGIIENANPKHYFEGFTISVYEDREKNLWFATKENGVYFLPSSEFKLFTSQKNFNGKTINCIEALGDSLLIGLNNGQINLLYRGNISNYDYGITNAKSITIMKKQSNGNLWIIYAKDFLSEKLILLNNNKIIDSLNILHRIKSLNEDPIKNRMLIGTRKHSFFINQKFQTDPIYLNIRIGTSFIDSNMIWVGNTEGLWLYKNNTLQNFNRFYVGLNNISAINKSKNGFIWVATNGNGLIIFKNKKFYQIKNKNGLLSNICSCLFIDEQNNIAWVGTNRGLNKINFSGTSSLSFKIESYTSNNRILSNQINSILKIKDTLYIATNNGLTFFNFKKIKPNTILPLLNIKEVKINGKKTSLTNNYNLSFNENNISISYSTVYFKNAKNILYKYKLEGLNNQWLYTNNNDLEFVNLPEHNYIFKVYAQNSDGMWSAQPAEICFTINAPYWKKWWFVAIIIILLSSVICIVIKNKIKLEKNKNNIKQQLIEFESKALRSQMNPHFMFNILNSIQNFIIKNDLVNAGLYLSKFSKLVRFILNTTKEPTILLSDEIEMLKLYLELEKLRMGNKLSYSINIENINNFEGIEIPVFLIQPFVENSIWHGISNKESSNGLIKIDFSLFDNKYLICIIEDNGIGRKKAKEITPQLKHNNVGTYNMQKRIDFLDNSSVKIIDLTDFDGNAIGTKIELKIKVL